MHVCIPPTIQTFQRLISLIAEAAALKEERSNLLARLAVSVVLVPDRSWSRCSGGLRTWAGVTDRRLVEEACSAWDIRQAGRSFHNPAVEDSSIHLEGMRIWDRPEPSCSYSRSIDDMLVVADPFESSSSHASNPRQSRV